MKKIKLILLPVLAALLLAGCSGIIDADNQTEHQKEEIVVIEEKIGNVSVSMFIPDYNKITSRVIAPQTRYARLRLSKFSNQDTIEIKDEDLSDVENAESIGLPGKIWKAKFSAPVGTYKEGELVIELLDSDKKVITSGENSIEITISEEQPSSGTFFTVPQSADNNKGSLSLNEMKFFKVSNPVAGEKICVVESELNGAQIIRFNKDGSFGEIVTGFEKDAEFNVTDATVGSYYGIWAKDKAIDSYSARLVLSKNIVNETQSIIEDFEGTLANVWNLDGYEPGETVNCQPAKTTGKIVYEHENASSVRFGFLSRKVYVSGPSAVTFSFYPDTGSKLFFFETVSFSINGEEKGKWEGKGLRQTYTFALPEAGEYELKWNCDEGTSYLDKVSIALDSVKTVEITPKGLQTVLAGQKYTFTANALREDGSVIEGKSVSETKTFSTAGKQTFSMQIDGISADTEVNVIADITSPVVYMGKTYSGITTHPTGSIENQCPSADDKKLVVQYPSGNVFDADGFFPLKLTVNNPNKKQFVAVFISGPNHDTPEFYVYRGNPESEKGELETRIWLRWGKGSYTVSLHDATNVSWDYEEVDGTTSEDGSVIYYGDNIASINVNSKPSVEFTVNNTRDEDGTYLYPSSVIQCDNMEIMNKAADLTAGLTDTKAKIKIIHDWIVTSKFYDLDSRYGSGSRKRQDAVAVMEYGMCVCEGYANLTAALLRNCGIQVKYISSPSLDHAWNEVNVGTLDSQDWRLLDSTWDDPILSTGDGGPYYVSYDNYLLEDLTGGSESHNGGEASTSRAVTKITGHIGGVENTAY